MNPDKTIKELAALREAAIEDLLMMSDADLRAEAKEDGEDLESIAVQVRGSMREAAAKALRLRMSATKLQSVSNLSTRSSQAVRPNLDQIKKIIQALFVSKPSLGLAFRDGKRQSENDWQSLYDDLVSIGAIKEGDNEH